MVFRRDVNNVRYRMDFPAMGGNVASATWSQFQRKLDDGPKGAPFMTLSDAFFCGQESAVVM